MKSIDELNEESFNKIKATLDSFSKFKLSLGIFNHPRAKVLERHEKGIGVEKREFIKKSIDLHKNEIIEKMKFFAKNTDFNKKDAIYAVLNATGSYINNNVIRYFINHESKSYLAPLKPSTIKRKKHDIPMRDTDLMYNNLDHIVSNKS
jgi:hypothetical protein